MKIYRVQGYYATGYFVSHEVGAFNVRQAINSVLDADNRIIRVTKALPITGA